MTLCHIVMVKCSFNSFSELFKLYNLFTCAKTCKYVKI